MQPVIAGNDLDNLGQGLPPQSWSLEPWKSRVKPGSSGSQHFRQLWVVPSVRSGFQKGRRDGLQQQVRRGRKEGWSAAIC